MSPQQSLRSLRSIEKQPSSLLQNQQESDVRSFDLEPSQSVENQLPSHPRSEIDRARPPVPTHPSSRIRSKTVMSTNLSLSSEDFYGARTTYDARPRNSRHERVRASTWTQTSGATLSSLYPPSTSDMTGTDSPPDPSTPTESSIAEALHEEVDDSDVDAFERHQLDPDDVSYRLRLLVRNNYYLPPAHSKPIHATLHYGQDDPQTSSKSSSSSLRDLFRLGSSKGRAAQQLPMSPPLSHVQRALDVQRCRDSSLEPNGTYPIPLQNRSVSADVLPEKERKGRVVVIRERLEDLDTRPAQRTFPAKDALLLSRPSHDAAHIDPTDVVDLPSYGFEPQASIGNVLGQHSLGAATLADFLPHTSNASRGVDLHDEAWRRALLLEAVDHSMSSIPDAVGSSSMERTLSLSSVHEMAPALGQPILRPSERPELNRARQLPELSSPAARSADSLLAPDFHVGAELSTAQVQALPFLHSLPPPPRKKPKSSPTTARDPTRFGENAPRHTIRKTLSTPLLSDAYPPRSTPPLVYSPPSKLDALSPDAALPSWGTSESLSSDSHYSDDGEHSAQQIPRASLNSMDESALVSNRPSLSVSQLSHRSSAFGPPSPILPDFTDSKVVRESTSISSLARRRTRSPRMLNLAPTISSDPSQSVDCKTPTIALSTDRSDEKDDGVLLIVKSRPRVLSNSSSVETPRPASSRTANASSGPSNSNVESLASSSTVQLSPTLPFEILDRTKPVTNTPSIPTPRLFAHRPITSKRSPRIPESTFELLKQSQDIEADLSHQDAYEALAGSERGGVSAWAREQGEQHNRGDRVLDGMLRLHIEAEKDHMRRIANNLWK